MTDTTKHESWIVHGINYIGNVVNIDGNLVFSGSKEIVSKYDIVDVGDHLDLQLFMHDDDGFETIKVEGYDDKLSTTILNGVNPISVARSIAKAFATEMIITSMCRTLCKISADGEIEKIRKISDFYLDVDPELVEFLDMNRYL